MAAAQKSPIAEKQIDKTIRSTAARRLSHACKPGLIPACFISSMRDPSFHARVLHCVHRRLI